jgi:hypothetical protein
MGLFDLPSPLFAWLDRLAGMVLPPWLRLIVWGLLAASISMLLYRQLSDQDAISRGKHRLKAAQQRLNTFDGELNDAWPLMRAMLRTALRQVVRVGWPGMVASVPLLFLLSWLSTSYGYVYPTAGQAPALRTQPQQYQAHWIDAPADAQAPPRILVVDDADQLLADVALNAPVPVIHKKRWWNLLMGNPAGYLPDWAAIDRIVAPLPRQEVLSFGPGWLRNWEIMFFISLLAVSLGMKKALKIK